MRGSFSGRFAPSRWRDIEGVAVCLLASGKQSLLPVSSAGFCEQSALPLLCGQRM